MRYRGDSRKGVGGLWPSFVRSIIFRRNSVTRLCIGVVAAAPTGKPARFHTQSRKSKSERLIASVVRVYAGSNRAEWPAEEGRRCPNQFKDGHELTMYQKIDCDSITLIASNLLRLEINESMDYAIILNFYFEMIKIC